MYSYALTNFMPPTVDVILSIIVPFVILLLQYILYWRGLIYPCNCFIIATSNFMYHSLQKILQIEMNEAAQFGANFITWYLIYAKFYRIVKALLLHKQHRCGRMLDRSRTWSLPGLEVPLARQPFWRSVSICPWINN